MVGRNGVQTDVCPVYRAAQYARLEGISSIRLVGIGIVGRDFSRDIIAAVKPGFNP